MTGKTERLPLFEIALPAHENNGMSNLAALDKWEAYALGVAGGFTRKPGAEGRWLDKNTGKLYRDHMIPYRVACNEVVFAALVEKAFELFADQVAIFTSRVGEAVIVYRPSSDRDVEGPARFTRLPENWP